MPADRLFATPDLYVRELDPALGEAVAVPMTRDAYARSSFLDHRAQAAGPERRLQLDDLRARYEAEAPAPRPLRFVFHTAFCGSTLLCRALDRPGACLAYKEPLLLHQLSAFRRHPAPETAALAGPDWLRLALALLERTYAPGEVALVKPSDSCVNLAPALMAAHPDARALVLYMPLEAFLLTMLKLPRRITYLRSLLPRARADLHARGLLTGVRPETLSDAHAAAYVWLGLMYPYHELLSDDRLPVRSLDAALLFDRPLDVVDAAARFFDLPFSPGTLREVAAGVLGRHAKRPDEAFDRDAFAASKARLAHILAPEIEAGIAWAAAATQAAPLPPHLPRPLLSPA